MGCRSMKILGCLGLFRFLENITDSDLDGLNVTSHLVAHWCIFNKSEFNSYAACVGLSTII